MAWISRFIGIALCGTILMSFLTAFRPAFAQMPPVPSAPMAAPTQCSGPPDICSQIQQLQTALATQKSVNGQTQTAVSTRMEKLIAAAGTIAVVLKLLVSFLRTYYGYLKGDRGEAIIKITMVVLGIAILLLTNFSFGMPWWQCIIAAGGPPMSIAVHEIWKLVPAALGKAPLPPDERPTPVPPVSPV